MAELELMYGTVDLLVLRTLAWESMHGYGISQFVRDRTGGKIAIESAALYQALHRLEKRQFVRSWWGISENNRQAKYYSLARAGRSRLQAGSTSWHRFVEVAGQALRATAPAAT